VENKSLWSKVFLLQISLYSWECSSRFYLLQRVYQLQFPMYRKGSFSERVLEILDADVKIEEIAEPVSISTLQNNIEFKILDSIMIKPI
jgi:hypothetical protein